jgi:hypothetical protein
LITPLQGGVYTLTAQDSNSCKNADTIEILFRQPPTYSIDSVYTICSNGILQLKPGNNPGAIYLWGSDSGFIATGDSVAITQASRYWFTISNALNCSATDTFLLNRLDTAVFAEFLAVTDLFQGDTVKMVNLSFPEPYTSFWDFGDGLTSADDSPMHIYFLTGNVKLTLTVSNGICTDSKSKTITIERKNKPDPIETPIISEKVELISNAKAYPNPNRGQFAVDVELAVEREVLFHFFDLRGRVYEERKISGNRYYHEIFDHSGLARGLYFVRVSSQSESKVLKLIIY